MCPRFFGTGRAVARLAFCFSMFLVFSAGCAIFPEEEDFHIPELIQPTEVAYTTITARRGSISVYIKGKCVVKAEEQFDLSFERSGYLEMLNAKAGQQVQ